MWAERCVLSGVPIFTGVVAPNGTASYGTGTGYGWYTVGATVGSFIGLRPLLKRRKQFFDQEMFKRIEAKTAN